MKKKGILSLMVAAFSLTAFLSCTSDDEGSGNDVYYVEYTVTGGAWYRLPFGVESKPAATRVTFQNVRAEETECGEGRVAFTKTVGPVGKDFKASLVAAGMHDGKFVGSFEAAIDVLKGGKLIRHKSTSGNGQVIVTLSIND